MENQLVRSGLQSLNDSAGMSLNGDDGEMENLGLFNLDSLSNEINQIEDLNELDNILFSLQQTTQQKSEMLKRVKQENDEVKKSIESIKYSNAELEQMQAEELIKSDNLKLMIEAQRMELEQVHCQQVDDLVQFENDVHNISEKFMGAPKKYESNTLNEKVLQLKKDLEETVNELSQYKQDLQIAEGKYKQAQKTDVNYQEVSANVFAEGVGDIMTLNDNLKKTVEELTRRVNSLRFEIGSLGLQR